MEAFVLKELSSFILQLRGSLEPKRKENYPSSLILQKVNGDPLKRSRTGLERMNYQVCSVWPENALFLDRLNIPYYFN